MEIRKLFLSASLLVFATLVAVGQSGTWSVTGSMAHARSGQGTAVLQNGNVLVVGGWNLGVVDATAEIYNSTNGTWTGTGSVNLARYGAPAVTTTATTSFRLPSSSIRQVGRGPIPGRCTRHDIFTPRFFSRPARCWSPEVAMPH